MHEKTIEQLFYGQLCPSNSSTYKTEVYIKASRNIDKLNGLLVSKLNEEQKKLLDDLLESKDAMTDEMVLGAFKDGFKIGMGLAAEGLSSNNMNEA